MSEHELMLAGRDPQNINGQDEYVNRVVINAYEPNHINEQAAEESLRQFYVQIQIKQRSLDFPFYSDYIEPNLQPIAQKKAQLRKQFAQDKQLQLGKVAQYDGVYSSVQQQANNQMIRVKTRLVRDLRQQHFSQNSEMITDRQFYHTHLSRLANISFQDNHAIHTFQKNAILSERSNQKKNQPFQLEINLGFIWLNKHALQNQQEIKFQELRPLLKQYYNLSTYPALAQMDKQIKYLLDVKQLMINQHVDSQQIQQVVRKLKISNSQYDREIQKMQKLMKQILNKWRQIKQIRRSTAMQTVPWKLNVKQYSLQQKKLFDIGVTPCEVVERVVGQKAEEQLQRRAQIRAQRYFVKVYINGYEVAKSQKSNLQWPSFRVPIQNKINVTVYSAPSSIQIQIIKSGIINKTVDTINLSLPGSNSKTITASQRKFAQSPFASNGHQFRKGKQPQSPSGMVVYRMEWKGQGSRMPPVSFKAQEQDTAASTEQSQNNQIQVIDYTELYDIKDPRVHHRSKKQAVQLQINRGKGAILPFADTQSARHLLLKMKASQPEFQKLQIPLTQDQIMKRRDLLLVLDQERMKVSAQADINQQGVYNTSQGIFQKQDNETIAHIKQILREIQNLKMDVVKSSSTAKYKITEQIINEYVFEQMESPIVVFFRNLFTQRRKLGPQSTYNLQARNAIDNVQINIHVRSAKNVPIRETSFAKIRQFQQKEGVMNDYKMQQFSMHTGNMDMMGNYGAGFYQRAPNMNLQGQNFFVPGMNNMPGRVLNFQANYKKVSLDRNNSYIEMRFKKNLKRTQCFEGPYPQWNQTIQLNYNLKAEQMTIQKLYTNNEQMIKLFLFDMVEQSKPTTSIAEVRIKKIKYYLGRVDVPMSMMVAIPSLSGVFNIDRPLIIFGYGVKKAGLYDIQQDQQANKTECPDILTMVNIDMFTQPMIDNMHAYNEDRKFVTGSEESPLLLQKASDWLSDLNTKMYIRLWLNNSKGKSVFICRYLVDYHPVNPDLSRPADQIAPPPQFQHSIQRCARFVSMIPKKYTCKLLENTQEFHMTCDQILSLKMTEDHGILLCNYFNYIDKKQGRNEILSYLAIGKAFPYGKSIFVLRKNTANGDCQLWDPYAGNCYFFPSKEYSTLCFCIKYSKKRNVQGLKGPCNMLEIGCIVSPTNVYVNRQESLNPADLDFDFENKNLWKPFLTERMRSQFFEESRITTIQPPVIRDDYPAPSVAVMDLASSLSSFLKKQIQEERRTHFKPYTFKSNSNLSAQICRELLKKCEIFKKDYRICGQDSTLYVDYNHDIKAKYQAAVADLQNQKNRIKGRVDSDKMLYGITLNVPYTTHKDIWQKVQQTQIHLQETNDIDLVLSVQCFELSSHVISVWIFVGSITLIV